MSTRPADVQMLHILALDPQASLRFSHYTRKWYVSASIEIGDGVLLRSVTEHRSTPEEAVAAFFGELTAVDVHDFDHHIVTRDDSGPIWHRWNGATFTREAVVVR